MPVRSDPQTATAKWVTNLSASTTAIQRGVGNVTVAPGQAAAKAADKWLAKVTQAKTKFATNVARVSLADWQNAMTSYGISRIASGAQAKQGKMQSFMTDFLTHLNRGASTIDAMPTTTLEDGVAKAVAQIRYNATFKRSANG